MSDQALTDEVYERIRSVECRDPSRCGRHGWRTCDPCEQIAATIDDQLAAAREREATLRDAYGRAGRAAFAARRENATLREAGETYLAVSDHFRSTERLTPKLQSADTVLRAALAASPAAEEPSRCPRCEGYEATYHTFKGECSAAEEPQPRT